MAQKNKKPGHYRDETERKGKVTSVRLSDAQYEAIQRNANKHGQSMSAYMANVASKEKTGLTPALIVQMQNMFNNACRVVEQNAPEEVDNMQKEMKKIWLKLM
ncbi:hypothetical protein SAMN02910265_03108 [Ruminococcus flavefaciens]|uniref:Mobilization protein n=1 Tax=Ruminococcus flavefaciens TaxID=1265 RepID=A0A1H6LEC9_RUMFL|nr:hypothetical protein [Ruminococcus flavefaciens]SEH86708.1 hypothetical protein SAMN02910265_03108 [Ruminococcus flavefaciens]